MRSRILLVLVVLLPLLAWANTSGLVNAGFDAPKDAEPPECDEPAGWIRWGSWVNRHTNQPRWQARSGPGVIVYHHWESDSTNAGWYQERTNLVAGGYYRFSVWALWEANCNASNIVLKIEPLEGDRPYRVEKYTARDIRDYWMPIMVQTKLPEDVTQARFVIECVHGFAGDTAPAQGGIKFDDASLQDLSSRK